MAILFGKNHTSAFQSEPKENIVASESHGRVRRMYDEFTLSGELSLNDEILMMKLPPNAQLVDARLVAPSDGTTGQYDVGWNTNGVDAADQNGIFAGATEGDTGGGAVDSKLLGTAAGYNKKFAAAETQIKLFVIEATTASDTDVLQLEVYYLVD